MESVFCFIKYNGNIRIIKYLIGNFISSVSRQCMHKFYSLICKLNSLVIANPALVFAQVGFHFLLAFLFILEVMVYIICTKPAPILWYYYMSTFKSFIHIVCEFKRTAPFLCILISFLYDVLA